LDSVAWLYVAAIYGGACAVARRSGLDFPWRIAALFYSIVLIFLWPSLTGDVVNLPLDFLNIVPPWAQVARDHHVMNPEMNDLVLQIVPWAQQVRESWKSLHIPLWNASAASGYPLLANAQSSAFSIFRILALPFSLGRSFAVEAALKILLALTFTYLFCRRRDYAELPGAVGAICFGFSTFMMIWLHFPMGGAAAFLPAVIYCADVVIDRATFAKIVFMAVVVAAMIFCGHPETVLHVFLFTTLYIVWIVFVERRFATAHDAVRHSAALGTAVVLGVLLSAPLLMPFGEAVTKSYRYLRMKSEPEVVSRFVGRGALALLVQPALVARQSIPSPAETTSGFAGILGAGATIALLLKDAGSRRWRTREMLFVALTILLAGVMLDWPVFRLITPLLRSSSLGRIRLLLCFLLAVQTAALIDLAARRIDGTYLTGILSATLLLFLAFKSLPNATLRGLIPSGLVIVVAALVPAGAKLRYGVMMILVVAVIAELWSVSRDWLPNLRSSAMYPPTPLISKLVELKNAQRGAPMRIVATGGILFPNTSAMFGLQDIRAHDPMAPARYLQILFDVAGYDVGRYYGRWRNVDTPLLDFLNVKYVVVAPGVDLPDRARYRRVYDGPDGRIFQNAHVLPRFFSVQRGTSVGIVAAESDRYHLQINAATPSLVASSIPAWPGWKVVSAGRSLDTVAINDAFLGFNVPAGRSDVSVSYSPLMFWVGAWIAVATLIGICAAGHSLRPSDRRHHS
jgi:Bacterial membrane protein YfhO